MDLQYSHNYRLTLVEQVLQLMLSEGDRVTLRATPLDQTSIRTGGRKREPNKSRLARRAHHRLLHAAGHGRRGPPGAGRSSGGASGKDLSLSRESASERRRKTSLFRRLSSKRASAEIQQQVSRSAPEFFFPFFQLFFSLNCSRDVRPFIFINKLAFV